MTDLCRQFNQLTMVLRDYPKQRDVAREKWNGWNNFEIQKRATKVEKLSNGIAAKSKLSPVDLVILLQKVKSVYTGMTKEEFTGREIRNFPFILLEMDNSLALCRYIFTYIDLDKTLLFRRVLFSYFNKYDMQDSRISFLQKELHSWVLLHPKISERNEFLKQSPFLLDGNGAKKMGKMMLERGIVQSLQHIKFPDVLFGSKFVKIAIQEAFHLFAPIRKKYSLLEEITKNPLYKAQIPYIIGPMIIGAEKEKVSDIKSKLMELIFKEMGDPRGKRSEWIHVEREAKEIYYRWMVKNDFRVFFTLIEKTAGRTSDGDHMWKYRQAFWKCYLDEISMSCIVLGEDARRLARQEHLNLTNYDLLDGKTGDSSLLVFVIGDYTFIEPSHSGKLRIYKNESSPVDIMAIGHKRIDYRNITSSNTVMDFTHFYTSNGAIWQPRVRTWIQEHCRIWRNEKQWRL